MSGGIDIPSIIAKARAERRAALDEASGKAILQAYGLTVPNGEFIKSPEEMSGKLSSLVPPFAVKASASTLLHKSDAGGVALGLTDVPSLTNAIACMRSKLEAAGHNVDGFLVEEMAPPGHEMVIGATHDPQFGPLVMVGMGGVFIEVFKDVAFGITPLTRQDAVAMIDELQARPLLEGARGGAVANMAKLIDAILAIGGPEGLLADHADVFAEIDINPIIVSETSAVAVDARFVLRPS